jgi:hypothetical protein
MLIPIQEIVSISRDKESENVSAWDVAAKETVKEEGNEPGNIGGVIAAVSDRPLTIFTTFAEIKLLAKNRDKLYDQLYNLKLICDHTDHMDSTLVWYT